MDMMIVGGTFDDQGGKGSGVVTKIISETEKFFYGDIGGFLPSLNHTHWINGHSTYEELANCIHNKLEKETVDVILWMPNIPNDKDKELVKYIKEKNKKVILVTSKRNFYVNDNHDREYTFAELVNHALGLKANLFIEFCKLEDNNIQLSLYDPLGNMYCRKTDIHGLGVNE
jgi:hypothetical protein